MNAGKSGTVIINLLGGAAVLGSYAWGLGAVHEAASLWGGVPAKLRPTYTTDMLLAAAGYFLFSYFILFCLPAETTRVAKRWGYGAFNLLYALILIFSAFWMPLTVAAVQSSRASGVWLVRLDLAIVALASLALLFALINVEPRDPGRAYALAIAGVVLFCVQTVVLDAIVWLALFHP